MPIMLPPAKAATQRQKSKVGSAKAYSYPLAAPINKKRRRKAPAAAPATSPERTGWAAENR
ncbi:hypothetical protein GCM10009734_33290 [Nonomuraea bangladeshensis]